MSQLFIAVLAFISLLPGAALIRASGAEFPCLQILDPAAAARAQIAELAPKLGGKTVVSELSGGEVFRRYNDTGSIIGSNYVLYPRDEIMVIDFIKVEASYRKTGVSRLLIAEPIARHPEIRVIKATLAWVNAGAFFHALNSTALKTLEGKAPTPLSAKARSDVELEALGHTPLFRVIKSLGFSHVTTLKDHGDQIEITVERSALP